MGCCSSRNSDLSLIEEKLAKFTFSLSLSSLMTRNVEFQALRLKESDTKDLDQVDKICSALKIEKETNDYILVNLIKEKASKKTFCQLLTTLGVLYGKDTKEMKILTLFNNYDINSNDKLQSDDVKLMVSDIFIITIEKFLRLAIISSTDCVSESLCSYQLKLMRTKKMIVLYFFHFLSDGVDILDYSWFFKLFKRRELNVLLDPRLFRSFAFNIFETIYQKNSKEGSESTLDDTYDLKIMRRFTKRLTKIV